MSPAQLAALLDGCEARAGTTSQTGTRRIISLSGATNSGSDAMTSFIVRRAGDPDTLPDDPALLQQMLCELYAENDKLRLLIQRFTRHEFGRRPEQLTPDQLQFGLEGLRAADCRRASGGPDAPRPQATIISSKPRTTRPTP